VNCCAIGVVVLLVATGAANSAAQSREVAPLSKGRPQWKVIVRIVPNPVPVGRCAAIRVEVQDDEGYVSSELRDGSTADSRRFKYESSNGESFHWQNDKPAEGYLCVDKDAKPGSTQVMVTLPDGLSGSVELTSVAAGQVAAPVQYPPQGLIRHAGFKRALVPDANVGALLSSSTTTLTTSALTMIGPYFELSSRIVDTDALMMTGSYFAHAPITVTTGQLEMTGPYFSLAAITVTTGQLEMTGPYAAPTRLGAPATPRHVPPSSFREAPPQTPRTSP